MGTSKNLNTGSPGEGRDLILLLASSNCTKLDTGPAQPMWLFAGKTGFLEVPNAKSSVGAVFQAFVGWEARQLLGKQKFYVGYL